MNGTLPAIIISLGFVSTAATTQTTLSQALKEPLASPACPDGSFPGLGVVDAQNPAIGREQTVAAGEPVSVTERIVVHEESLRLLQPTSFSGQSGRTSFIVNVASGTLRGIDTFAFTQHATRDSYRLVNATIRTIGKDGTPGQPNRAKLWLVAKEDGTTLHADVKVGSSIVPIDMPNAPISRSFCITPANDAVRREILYGGVAKGVVTFQYRESINRLARPAFDQQGTFDLAEGKEISFKGIRLTVLDASNTGLRYVVTKGFGE